MKIAFYIAAIVMIAVALAALLVPLLRQGRRSGRSRGVFILAILIAFALPLSAAALYLWVGTPVAINGASAQAQSQLTLPQALAELQQHLKQQPDDIRGWMLLAQTSTTTKDFAAARDAYDHVLKIDANNAGAMVGWAESDSMVRDDHQIDGRGRKLLQRAVQMHPDNQRGLWLLGISDFQHGNYQEAAATWRLLQPQLEPGSSVAKSVAEQIVIADARAGNAPASTSSTARAAALHVEVALAPALKQKLAPGDVLFVYARAASGSSMPLAVAKLNASDLPVSVSLNDAMAMTPSMNLSSAGQVFVGARITHNGQPTAQPGDLEGDAGVVEVNRKTPVKITIDKVH